MSEKEKMLNGEYYKPMEDKQLSSDRDRVKELCRKYNSLAYTDIENRDKSKITQETFTPALRLTKQAARKEKESGNCDNYRYKI